MTPQAQAETMIQRIQAKQSQTCHTLVEGAKQQAKEIINKSYQEVMQEVKQVIAEERVYITHYSQMQNAKLWTVEQQVHYQQEQAFIEKALHLIQMKLSDFWQNKRNIWLDKILQQALKILFGKSWLIEHTEDFTETEQLYMISQINKVISEPLIEFKVNTQISAGIIIQQEYIILDGSLEGLLKDKNQITANLLFLLKQELTK